MVKKGFTLYEALKVAEAKESKPNNFKVVKEFAMFKRGFPEIEAEIIASKYLLVPEID